jgi:hypothetical protein
VHGVVHDAALASGKLTRGVNRRSAYLSEVIMSRRPDEINQEKEETGWIEIA